MAGSERREPAASPVPLEQTDAIRSLLRQGLVIPAHPLALTADRRLDEGRQRALTRYYASAGVGGIAVGVHTTQFAIRNPEHGLYRPVLELAAETARAMLAENPRPFVMVAGICGKTEQAVREAETARSLGYDAGLLSLGAWRDEPEDAMLAHCRTLAGIIPLFGFYLQPAVGGRILSYRFWQRFLEIPAVVAIKIAPFNRYQTLDVVRAVAESGREDVALYTGNDDNIVADLLTPFRFGDREIRIVGGLLGQWAVWTRRAVALLDAIRSDKVSAPDLLALGARITDANAAIFDAANGFRGCIPGIHETLRRQGLLRGIWCLDPEESLSPGQAEGIERVSAGYPELTDDEFVAQNVDHWLR